MRLPIRFKRNALFLFTACAIGSAHAAPSLIAIGELSGSTAGSFADLSGLSGNLENGLPANMLGGIGSGLAYAGGNTFLALPDRGPNATVYNLLVDNTSSYIARFQTVTLNLTATPSGSLPFTLTPTLNATTLLSSSTPLTYGTGTLGTGTQNNVSYTLGSGVPAQNSPGTYYFTGRSDNFAPNPPPFSALLSSTNPNNGRLDPEGIRVSNDGKNVFVADEYGPYVYQFDRQTGARTNTFALPSYYAINNLSAVGASEIAGNTVGRVTNKGMEGLAITPDGKTLVGFMQSPLAQDGGDGGKANRIVSIDIATGATKQYVYNNFLSDTNKNYNSSELLAINNHEFLVLERDGKGLGDGSSAVVKRLYKIDLNGATDIGSLTNTDGSPLSGEANLLPNAVTKTLFLDIRAALNAKGITDANIPAKLEGAAFGDDIVVNGATMHTLYIANDNDFVPGTAGTNKFFVFSFSDADLNGSTLALQSVAAIPEPETYGLMLAGLALIGTVARRRKPA